MNNSCIGIVLSLQEFKDNDMIMQVLSEEYGVLPFLARGIKKTTSKNAPACMPFHESRFSFRYKEASKMQSLMSAERVHMHRHIYDDLHKQIIASLLCEICRKSENIDFTFVFQLLRSMLRRLDEGDNIFCTLGFFVAKMNALFGIAPNVEGCVFCQNDRQIAGISLYDGGFVCAKHFQKERHASLSVERLRYFRLFHKAGLDDYAVLEGMKKYTYEDIEMILKVFLEYSGMQLQGWKLLHKIITFEPME